MDHSKTKIEKNNVKSRFLELCPSAAKGLEPECKIQDFTIKELLGEGSFGKVYKVEHNKTKAIYAIKAIDKRNKNNQEGKPYFRREIEIMYKVRHPNIVRLFSHFEDDYFCYFLMEFINKGNLYQYKSKQKSKSLEAKAVANIMRDIISAVHYLHNMDPSIIHRDIKPENVLIDENMRTKLTDFGWSNYVSDDKVRSTYCGTPIYLAPEMIKEIGHDEYLDVWCIGVLMFELLTGYPPFNGSNMNVLSDNIIKGKIQWPQDINLEAKDLISKVLKTDPKERLGLKQMLNHPFFTKVTPFPDFIMITPKDQNEEDNKIFIVSEDIPVIRKIGVRKNTEILKKLQEKDSNNNVAIPPSTEGTGNNNAEYEKLKAKYDKSVARIEELDNYSTDLKNKYDRLYKEYNEMKSRVIGHDKEKENLLKELDDKANELLNLKKKIFELNDKIEEKDNKVKILAKTIKIIEEKNDKLDEQIKKIEEEYDAFRSESEKEKKSHLEQISALEGKLIYSIDNYTENRISSLRESITNLNQNSIFQPSQNNAVKDKDKEFQDQLIRAKEQFMNEIEDMKQSFIKEKENYMMMLKNKDDYIRKFEDEKKNLKASVEKSLEMKIYKLNLQLSTKDAEIEKLNAQLKKYKK